MENGGFSGIFLRVKEQENRPGKIISGGQTGVDRAALDVALSLGIPAGGWCPAGRTAEDGVIPPRYPLQELSDGGYLERTERNVAEAEGTVIVHGGVLRGGSKATADFCAAEGKPCLLLDISRLAPAAAAEELARFVRANRLAILNVAGPRASEWPQGYDVAREILSVFLGAAYAPRLSFVVPAHNEEHELPGTLRALRKAAEASGESYEIIVVDDASNDATPQIAEQSGARLLRIERRQIAAARNAGARTARGDILFFVDADTHINASHVEAALRALAEGCVGGGARVAMDRKLPFWGRLFLGVFSVFYFGARLAAGAFVFTRRGSFEKVGGFDEQYFAGEEVYLSLALQKLGRFIILREPIVTSARKLRMHAPRHILGQFFFLVFGGRRALRSRDRLSLWYDGKREQAAIR